MDVGLLARQGRLRRLLLRSGTDASEEYVGAMDDELAEVFVGPPNQAEVMRSVLEGNGIKAVIRGSGLSGAYPTNVGTLAETTLLVPAKDIAVARRLLRAGGSEPSRDQARDRVPATYAFRRSVIRWFALIVLLVMVATLVTSLDFR